MLPNFLYIGPGRAGSSWISRNLMLHPDIFMPWPRDTRYFMDNYDKGLEWYESLFEGQQEKAVGEASNGYLFWDESPKRIHELIPDVKLIANLRNPVDKVYSTYGKMVSEARKGDANYKVSFEEKLKTTPKLIERTMYARHLKKYLDLFPRENILFLLFDDMVRNPQEHLRTIYSFLNVDPDFVSPLAEQKTNSSASMGGRSRLLYRVNRIFLKAGFFKGAKFIDQINRKQPEKVASATRKMLIEDHFKEDIRELEKLLDKDLSAWKRV